MVTARRRLPQASRTVDPAESQFEHLLYAGSRVAIIFIAAMVLLIVVKLGETILAPVSLALVIGLVFGPIADRLEHRGIPPTISAALVVLLLLCAIAAAVLLFAVPLSQWVAKVPQIWAKFQVELQSLKGPLDSLAALQNQVAAIFGGSTAMTVRVADGGTVTSIALIAPAIGAQIVLFLVSLYLFVASRHHLRLAVLSLCVGRRIRWRTAHVFTEVEAQVSRFLLSVTFLNLGVGVAVSLAMWTIGMPSPLLWGTLAAVTNYVPYAGQAVMMVILASVGLGTQSDLTHILLPVACYMAITFVEGQLITPQVLGRVMTLNPFMIFLAITFWLWVWGPIGGLVAVPSLLIVQSGISHLLPGKQVLPKKKVRRTAKMTDKDMILANAAQVIKEGAAETQEAEKATEPPKMPATDSSAAVV